VEYAILVGLVVAAVAGMQTYFKRGIQAGVKLAADRMGALPETNRPPSISPEEHSQLEGIRYDSGVRTTSVLNPGGVLERKSVQGSTVHQASEAGEGAGGARARTIVAEDVSTTGLVTQPYLEEVDVDKQGSPRNPRCLETVRQLQVERGSSVALSSCSAVVAEIRRR
jgi:hypothetical protein